MAQVVLDVSSHHWLATMKRGRKEKFDQAAQCRTSEFIHDCIDMNVQEGKTV